MKTRIRTSKPKYKRGDIIVIKSDDKVLQVEIVGAEFNNKTWNYYVDSHSLDKWVTDKDIKYKL